MARVLPLLVLAGVAATPAAAVADVLTVYGEAHGGGMYGMGIGGAQQDAAFSRKARGVGYGALVGAHVLIFDGHVKHHQYLPVGGSSSDPADPRPKLATWTQFNVGMSLKLRSGSEQQQKAGKGGYFEIGVFAGFGVGTGAQVQPPLDNAQITDKGFLLEGKLGVGKSLSRQLEIGISVPVSAGYMFKSGNGAAANDVSTHYQAVQADAMLVLRGNLAFL